MRAVTDLMRGVIYCRVSTKEQVQNLSLSTQLTACKAYCEREGIVVAEVFETTRPRH